MRFAAFAHTFGRLARRAVVIAVIAVAVVAGSTVRPARQHGGAAVTMVSAAAAAGPVARYTFDALGAAGTYADASGNGHTLRVLTRNGAVLHTTPHGTGQAVVFPPLCTAGTGCPRMVLQAPSAAALNPGSRPLQFGATVRLAANQTSAGQNILQKGYSATGGQYKLQVDKLAGHPSCALTGDTSSAIHLAKSSITVADGHWHQVACRRVGTALTVLVDGAVRGAATVPATLSIDNTNPLVLGGKGLSTNSDQYQGALDDAWISIG
jgi:hypothetical protein